MARPKYKVPITTDPDSPRWVTMKLDFDEPMKFHSEKYDNDSYGYSIMIEGREQFWYATEAAHRAVCGIEPPVSAGEEIKVLRTGTGTSTRWYAKRADGSVAPPPSPSKRLNQPTIPSMNGSTMTAGRPPYSPPEMDSLLKLADMELDKLVAMIALVKSREEFAEVNAEQVVRTATTALIAANRAYYPGIKFESELTNEELFVQLVKSGYDGSNLVEAVMKSMLIYTDGYDDMNDMVEYLKQVGLSREVIAKDEQSWVDLYRIAKRIGEMVEEDSFDPDTIVEEFGLAVF